MGIGRIRQIGRENNTNPSAEGPIFQSNEKTGAGRIRQTRRIGHIYESIC
jgi:hypothetical protein